MDDWQKKDLKNIWHPCSQMKDYEDFSPIIIEKGKGAYLYDIDGNKYLDAISSWWVNLFGHSHTRINNTIKKQVDSLEHVIFANFSHKPAIELSEKIIDITPEPLKKVFFADNGSSAIEVALKVSFQYHQQTGNASKYKFIALSNAYHGETIGALSVGGMDLYNKLYKPILINTDIVEGPDCFRCKYGKVRDTCNAQCFDKMQKAVELNHKDVCAIIIEPMVQAAAGMKIYSPVYLRKLRKICDEYNIHLIADEVAVGFGRTGKMFGCEHANISPDIMCLSKGLTAGYLPLSLVLTTNKIYDAFYDEYTNLKAFLHSHSYTGNPITCSIANTVIDIFKEENILAKNEEKAKVINQVVTRYAKDNPYIGEYRQLGMISALELVADKKTKEEFDWKKRIGYNIYKIAIKKGLIIRPLGNIIYFMPPYIIDNNDIEFMIDKTFSSINEFFNI